MGLLALGSATLVIIVSAVTWLVTPVDVRENGSLPGVLWRSMLGAMARERSTGSRLYLFLMFVVTIGGIVIFSALISILTAGLDAKITRLRRGRSRIIEESRRRPCVAILADLDRIETEEMIRERLGTTADTRVACRRGDPLKPADVGLVSSDTSRSIVSDRGRRRTSPPSSRPRAGGARPPSATASRRTSAGRRPTG